MEGYKKIIIKRVFIVHGWGGSPKKDWLPWLKKELQKKGFKVYVPKMPYTNTPKIKYWVSYLKKIAGRPDKDTYFIGHSIGCQTILRYLAGLKKSDKMGGAIFVAGWFTLKNLEPNEIKIAKPWVTKKIDINKAKKIGNKFVAIFSDNDPVIPLSNKNIFKEKLGAKIIMLHGKGHMDANAGVAKLPIVLDEFLKISK